MASCPFCNTEIPEGAPMCPECGYRAEAPSTPKGQAELTDAQIAAYAGFTVAEHEMRKSPKGPTPQQVKSMKIALFVVTSFIIPAILGVILQKLHVIGSNNPMASGNPLRALQRTMSGDPDGVLSNDGKSAQ